MKGVIWTILFILSLSFVSAFSIENVTHTSYETTLFSVIIPLDTVEVVLDNNDFNSSIIKVKVSKPLPAFVLNNSVNKEYSGFMAVNVSNYDFVRLIENNSVLYSDFILSLNTSVPIIVGDVNGFLDIGPYPFNGLVQSSTISGEKIIFIYGNAIDGEVAALRYLKKHLDEFVYLDKAEYVSDIDALSVYDYMHLEENHPYYNTDTKQFRDIVNKSLFGKVEEEVIDVKTNDGVLLRALKLKPENSQKLIEYRHNVSLPIVLARGLWSNLYSWQEFGLELADEGREVYLIEITGGPGQDCNDCVNYDFNDLINSYWPALIGTIQSLSNSSIQYVGHSNGARTGVSSLEVYNEVGMNNSGFYFNGSDWINVSMTPHPVDTFIAVGMPGAFEGENSLFGRIVQNNYDEMTTELNNKNKSHVSFWDVFQTYWNLPNPFKFEELISLNLTQNYLFWIKYENDTQPLVSNLSKMIIITGTKDKLKTDGIVTVPDNNYLFNTSNATKTEQYYVYTSHSGMGENGQIRYVLKKRLNNENLTNFKKMQYSYRER